MWGDPSLGLHPSIMGLRGPKGAMGVLLLASLRRGVMTKSDLAEAVAARTNVPRADAERVVDQVFEAITEALVKGERVELRGLGVFEVRHYGAYTGKNPRTGEPVAVKPKRLPFFKAGKEIRERLNLEPAAQAEQEQ